MAPALMHGEDGMIEQLRFDANFIGMKSPKLWIVSELAHLSCPRFQRTTLPANAAKLRPDVRTSDTTYEEKQLRETKPSREGILSKRLSAPYRSGPSRDWIKVKNPDSPAMIRRQGAERVGSFVALRAHRSRR